MFVLSQVSKSYGTAVALHPLDLEIEAGRTTVVIGPSGCGKSTLVIALAVKPLLGLRATDIEIEDGLDLTQHGERAYTP